MKQSTRLTAALKDWKRLERLCAESGRDDTAFLTDDAGELLLFEGQPVLNCGFAMAWEARHRVERIAAEEGVEVPPIGISAEYGEWPSVEALTELFMLWGSMKWADVSADLLVHFHQVEPSRAATVTSIGSDQAW